MELLRRESIRCASGGIQELFVSGVSSIVPRVPRVPRVPIWLCAKSLMYFKRRRKSKRKRKRKRGLLEILGYASQLRLELPCFSLCHQPV